MDDDGVLVLNEENPIFDTEGDDAGEYQANNGGDNDDDDDDDDEEAKEKGADDGDELDPYAYTKRDEFTSETFKIELRGLPKYYPAGQLKKLLNDLLQLSTHKIKPVGQGKHFAYITFKDETSRDKALVILNGYKWKGGTLSATEAQPIKDPYIQMHLDGKKTPADVHFLSSSDDDLSVEEKITKATAPYAQYSYEEQLQKKERMALNLLRKFGNELVKVNPELEKFVKWHKLRRKGQMCEVDNIVPSPVKEGYRNKCEFSIGMNTETDLPTVGFRVASYKQGSTCVAPIAHLRHIPDSMKKVVEVFEKFIRQSDHKPYCHITHEGIWKQLTVRTSRSDENLIVVVIHPQEFTEEELATIKESIMSYFVDGEGKSAGVTSIYFSKQGQKESGQKDVYEHVWGKPYITETILGKTFRCGPEAFLQTNTAAAELLYETVGKFADIDPTSVLLDLCCGTGTIGICLAEDAFKVYGVEVVEEAVEDARYNASQNDLENVEFWCGKVETVLPSILEQSQTLNTIAVLDPPRAGLSTSVVGTIRKNENVTKLVYVACDPQNAVQNFIQLGRARSKNYKGNYFVPIRAIPIDLFPDTPHYELVLLFERYEESKWSRIMAGNPRPKDQEYYDRIPKDYDKWEEKHAQVKKKRSPPQPQPQQHQDDKSYNYYRSRRYRGNQWYSRAGFGQFQDPYYPRGWKEGYCPYSHSYPHHGWSDPMYNWYQKYPKY